MAIMRFLVLAAVALFAQAEQQDSSESLVSATVGAPALLKDVVLPGSELVAKPLEGDPEMIVQIVDAIPHGDSYRYSIRFSGLEPGQHDLAKWLKRKDDSAAGELPSVFVEIESLLPAGQITPNKLPQTWLPKMGGYQVIMLIAATLWGLGLLALIFGGRRKPEQESDSAPPPATLADLLKTRLEAAFDDQVDTQQYAELERMLFSMWRRKLGFDALPVAEALSEVKAHHEAGPLLTQLESWMHQPDRGDGPNEQVDLAKLLEPYRNFSADELERSR